MDRNFRELQPIKPLPTAADRGVGDSPALLTASEASLLIADGRLTAEKLVRASLDRVERFESVVRAFSYMEPNLVTLQARARDNEVSKSDLHGLPIAVKDVINTFDMPTQHNSVIYSDHRPNQDAAVVASCRALGAIIMGKAETQEFAAGGRLPATRNPHNLQHTPGGSSAGSAAAVAAGFAALALGTQTGGSMLRPASFCGIFGFKPTYGVISSEGAKTYAVSLDTIGWYGRSVADLALLAECLRAVEAPMSLDVDLGTTTFGLCRTPWWDRAAPEAKAAVEAVAERLRKAGARVDDFTLPEEFSGLLDVQKTIMWGEGRAAFLNEYLANHKILTQYFRDIVENRSNISPAALCAALDLAAHCRAILDRSLQKVDALLTVGAVGEAPPTLATTGDATFQRAWTALHVPCVAIPCYVGPTGLPIGVQLIGARYRDAELLQLAAAVAEAIGVSRVAPVAPAAAPSEKPVVG